MLIFHKYGAFNIKYTTDKMRKKQMTVQKQKNF